MKTIKVVLLCGAALLLHTSLFAQKDCEKIFVKAMKDIQTHVKKQQLSQEEANEYILAQNEALKKKYPNCFPETEEAPSTKQAAVKASKLDSQELSDDEIQKINTQYVEAQKMCKKELISQLKKMEEAEAKKLLHECTMEKIVTKDEK